jgi:nocturnin
MLEVMLEHDPDILCLQEVDKHSFFNTALESVGYSGTFTPKPDSPCLYVSGNSGPDGCAIFYRKDKFWLEKADWFVLSPDHPVTNQIAAYDILVEKSKKIKFCVLTTHFKARQGYDNLRKEQAEHLVEFIQKDMSDIPVVMCGDMNGNYKEPLYEVVKSSPVPLESIYTKLQSDESEPPFTTWKIRGSRNGEERESCKTIDYIWVTQSSVGVSGLLELPTEEQIGPDRLPAEHYPSDHLELMADLFIKCD